MKLSYLIFILLLIIKSPFVFADHAKVLMIKGSAYFKPSTNSNKVVQLKKGSTISGNGIIHTNEFSFVRIGFQDGSTINIAAKTAIALAQKRKDKPKLIKLINGKIRGAINPLHNPPKGFKHKLIIKTRSASIGVRGTDFIVLYNEANHITSNITLKGEVDIYKESDKTIYESLRQELDQKEQVLHYDQQEHLNALSQDLSHYSTQRIPVGHFSGAFPSYEKSISAVKISHLQHKSLTNNKGLLLNNGKRPKKLLTSHYKMGSNTQMNNSLVPAPRSKKTLEKNDYNKIKNSDGITHGGYVDLNTGIYIAPPNKSPIDKTSGTQVVPDELGGVDALTGEYVPPQGLSLDPLIGFKIKKAASKDRNVKENLRKLKNLTGPFNERISKALGIFKEITRLELYGFANYQYSTNILEDYYGEFRRISEEASMLWKLQGLGGFQLYHDNNWLIYPKAQITARFHEKDQGPIKELNRYTGMLGTEVHHKHKYFGRKARFIVDLKFTTRYMDWRRRNLFDFYTEDTGVKFSERLSFNRNNHLNLFYQIRAYQGYRDNDHGNIHNIGLNQELELSSIWSILWGAHYSYRRDKIDSQKYQFSALKLKFKYKDILPKSDLTFGYTYQYHYTRFIGPFDHAIYYKADLLLHRRLGDFWKLNFLYEFDRMRAYGVPVNSEKRSFIRQSFAVGLTMLF